MPEKLRGLYTEKAFERADERDDAVFYQAERLTQHLDRRALDTVEQVIGTLVHEDRPAILDLMGSFDSHLPKNCSPSDLVVLGLNARELEQNPRAQERVVHDLNKNPVLPFEDNRFDAVLNTVSVDYLVRPFEVFAEVARVLKPGGVFVVIFSNRMFKTKAIRIWQQANDQERQMIVEDYFGSAPVFGPPASFVSKGRPRPRDDKYAGTGMPSDPVLAVWAEKRGGPPDRPPRPRVVLEPPKGPDEEEVARRKAKLKHTLTCPYCEQSLVKWEVPVTPFNEWPDEYIYVCFNNDCPYLVGGWDVMSQQGNHGFSYRFVYSIERDSCMASPVASIRAYAETTVTPRG